MSPKDLLSGNIPRLNKKALWLLDSDIFEHNMQMMIEANKPNIISARKATFSDDISDMVVFERSPGGTPPSEKG